MLGFPVAYTNGKHFTNIDIGKILALAKGLIPQQKSCLL